MNLREFINHNSTCPICSAKITLAFHSKRRQTIRIEEDRLLVLFSLNAMNNYQNDFKVGYSFGLDDNSLLIEFYSKDEKVMNDRVPMFLIDRFRSLNDNLGFYRFYKICPCDNYGCRTQDFLLKAIGTIPPIKLINEFWTLKYKESDGHRKVINFINDYSSKQSEISFRTEEDYDKLNYDSENSFTIPLIPFVSVEETSNRLRKFLTFS